MSGVEGQVDMVSALVEVLAEWDTAHTVGGEALGGAQRIHLTLPPHLRGQKISVEGAKTMLSLKNDRSWLREERQCYRQREPEVQRTMAGNHSALKKLRNSTSVGCHVEGGRHEAAGAG